MTFTETQNKILTYLVDVCGARRKQDGHLDSVLRAYLKMELAEFSEAVQPLIDDQYVWAIDSTAEAPFGKIAITATGRVAYRKLFPKKVERYEGDKKKPLAIIAGIVVLILIAAYILFEPSPEERAARKKAWAEAIAKAKTQRVRTRLSPQKPKKKSGGNTQKPQSLRNPRPKGRVNQAMIAKIKRNSIFVCPKATEPITVDGNLQDWQSLPYSVLTPAQIIGNAKSYRGTRDCKFRFGVATDNNNLYIAVKVTDDIFWRKKDAFVWAQDGVEIRLDARPAAIREKSNGTPEFSAVFIAAISPAGGGFPSFLYDSKRLPAGTRVVSKKTATGYITEVSIPNTWLDKIQKKRWQKFRLNICVDDFDSPQNGCQLWWHPDWRYADAIDGSGTFKRE